ncbi:MAG: nitrogen fixation protein NifEN [Thermodesulfovibrio sp.]|nr:nitrogen fixation protein NifEN [Thermodesulfovibrio sp.]
MTTNLDKLTEHGCGTAKKDKVCRSRGGESCAFDGAMIVLQPIADAAHIVHGPIACCGNSWEGRGTLSSRGILHRMGFTTDLSEMDIIYGAEGKLRTAIAETAAAVKPKAIFVYATCVTGLIGEDLEGVCKKTAEEIGIPVIPVNAPGFVGPKNLGNRIAGEALLQYVIGTGELPFHLTPPLSSPCQGEDGWGSTGDMRVIDVNLIGEYNIAGDLWLIEPVLKAAGIRILSRITGDSTFEEITYAHKAALNVVVCSRALINVAKEMERKYGIPYVEVSFFGKTEMSKALRLIGSGVKGQGSGLGERIEQTITAEEKAVNEKLKAYTHLKGKKALLYTGGVKSWSFISALLDLGIEIVGIGTKKSTFEDEEKMKQILGGDAPLIEDTTPKNLLRLLKESNADILVAGGRNQYLAVKEGYPFVDVNQERHTAYAGYEGLVNLAKAISNSISFYGRGKGQGSGVRECEKIRSASQDTTHVVINPLKHSQAIGAAIALQGIDRAIPVIHGAQGCTFLGKVLLTKHFREPIALAGTKLFAEDVVMGSEEKLSEVIAGLSEKSSPDLIAVLTSGLSEVKGDDVEATLKGLRNCGTAATLVQVSTPDYEGGLESGYARAVESLLSLAESGSIHTASYGMPFEPVEPVMGERECQVNVIAGSHLTPSDFTELREIVESFGLRPILLPDLSCLDGSRQGVSPLAIGGTTVQEIRTMGSSDFTIAIGASMEAPARILKERFGIEFRVFDSLTGVSEMDEFMEVLTMLSNRDPHPRYSRQRRILIDGMRDAHFYTAGKRAMIALEPDHCVQVSRILNAVGIDVPLAVIPAESEAAAHIRADAVITGDLSSLAAEADILISNSHAEDIAADLGMPLLQAGFPAYKVLGQTAKLTVGYRGALSFINDVANLLAKEVHS